MPEVLDVKSLETFVTEWERLTSYIVTYIL